MTSAEDHFVYLSSIDVSVDNGRGINEREFVHSLLETCAEEVSCILPRPKYPDRFSHPSVQYVKNHSASALRYGLHLHDAYRRVQTIHSRRPISGLVTRLEVAPFVPYVARQRLGIPTILKTLMVYGATREVFQWGRLPRAHRIVSSMLAPMFRSVIEHCAVADTVGEAVAEWTRRVYRIPRERLVVIPNGANTDVFVPGDRARARRALGLERFDKLIGYTGIFAGERHLETLIEAVAGLQKPSVALLMAGAGPLRGTLESLADRLGVARQVIFMGQIAYREVPAVLQALDVAIDLSLVPLRVRKGDVILASFSQKLAQYLAVGVPVIAWDLADTRVIAQHDVGRVVPVARPAAVREALAELLQLPPEEQTAMARRSRALAERDFSVNELVRRRLVLWKESVHRAYARS